MPIAFRCCARSGFAPFAHAFCIIALALAITSAVAAQSTVMVDARGSAREQNSAPEGKAPAASGAAETHEGETPPTAFQAPSARDLAQHSLAASSWIELQRLQEREEVLWRERDETSFLWPSLAVIFGLPIMTASVTMGTVLLVDASDERCYGGDSGSYSESCPNGRYKTRVGIGASLIGVGAAAAAAAVWGMVRIRQMRKAKTANERELRAISRTRTALENILAQQF
jgi:hypothetical protein